MQHSTTSQGLQKPNCKSEKPELSDIDKSQSRASVSISEHSSDEECSRKKTSTRLVYKKSVVTSSAEDIKDSVSSQSLALEDISRSSVSSVNKFLSSIDSDSQSGSESWVEKSTSNEKIGSLKNKRARPS